MIEGYENDDIYVMVEDEFLATAQTFTKHLHQEEYERRKKQARVRNASTIGAGGLARPTDPRAKMSAETRKNIEAQDAAKRHKAALDDMMDGAERPAVDSEEDIGATDDDRDDDPWVGTHLHGLMTSPRTSRSLIGLQGVKSNTRAAFGYSNACARRETSPTAAAQARVGSRAPVRSHIDLVEETASGEDDDDDDDDDLGARPTWTKPAPRQYRSAPRPSETAATATTGTTPKIPAFSRGTKKTTAVSKPSTITAPLSTSLQKTLATSTKFSVPAIPKFTTASRSSSASTGPTRPASSIGSSLKPTYQSRMSKLIDEFDEEYESAVKTEPSSPKRKSYTREPSMQSSSRSRERDRERDMKSRKDRLSEVPTFL